MTHHSQLTEHSQDLDLGRYINFFTDFGFKKLLGPGRKRQLIDFLNSLLQGTEKTITDLQYLQQEYPGATAESRTAIFDLRCQTDNGKSFIVELQNVRQEHFRDRMLYYASFPIQSQAKRGDWNFELGPVYCIALLNFTFDIETSTPGSIITTEKITNVATGVVTNNHLTFVYVELPKFSLRHNELTTHQEKWFYLMKNLATIKEVPEGFREDVFMEFLDEAEVAKLNPEERWAYERSLKGYRDAYAQKQYAIKVGMEEGRKVGMEEGRKEGRKEGELEAQRAIVKNLMAQNFDDEAICTLTGLSKQQLDSLR